MIQKSKPKVSIIMNCLNGEKYLHEAIDSVIGQTYTNWELIFWDNASTDSSAEILKSYDDDRIKYYRGMETIPLGSARNKAIEKTSGKFLCILDTDDKFLSNKLDIQVKYMLKNPEVVLGYSNLQYLVHQNGEQFIKENTKKIFEGIVFYQLITELNFIYLSTIIINKQLAGDKLFFKSEYEICEEYDLFIRLSLIGEFGYLSDTLGLYRLHQDSAKTKSKNRMIYLKERLDIVEIYSDEIKRNNIDISALKENLLVSNIYKFLRRGERKEARESVEGILEFPSIRNYLVYLFVKTNLSILYEYVFIIKKNVRILFK